MFLFIKDLINKIKTDEDNTNSKENIENNPSNITETDEPGLEQQLEEEDKPVDESENSNINKNKEKKKKNKKKNKKKERKQLLKPAGLAVLSVFIVFCISRIFMLTSVNEYLLDGKIYYNPSVKKYEISYEIEDLWNGGNFQIGEKVCVPDYFTNESTLTREKYKDCLEGKIIEDGIRIKIRYDLPKYISYDEFRLYISKDDLNKNFSKIYIRMKIYGDLKQIVEITPRN